MPILPVVSKGLDICLIGEESDLDEVVSDRPLSYRSFTMLYLGLFIGFLITTITVAMPTNRRRVFIFGTIAFGVVSLWCWIAAEAEKIRLNNLLKRIEKRRAHGETISADVESMFADGETIFG